MVWFQRGMLRADLQRGDAGAADDCGHRVIIAADQRGEFGGSGMAGRFALRDKPLAQVVSLERVALEFAIAAASQPNDVTDELFAQMKQHWNEGQIVEIAALVSYFGFMNRWNDTMATPLEDHPAEVAEKHISSHGWSIGKHKPR